MYVVTISNDRVSLQISQRKQSGCQFACIALMTRPITNLPTNKKKHSYKCTVIFSMYYTDNAKTVLSFNAELHNREVKFLLN